MNESTWPAIPVHRTRYLGRLDTVPLRFRWWRVTSIRSACIWGISWFYNASSFTAHIQTKSPQAHRPERNRSQTLSRVVCESKVAWIKVYGEVKSSIQNPEDCWTNRFAGKLSMPSMHLPWPARWLFWVNFGEAGYPYLKEIKSQPIERSFPQVQWLRQ